MGWGGVGWWWGGGWGCKARNATLSLNIAAWIGAVAGMGSNTGRQAGKRSRAGWSSGSSSSRVEQQQQRHAAAGARTRCPLADEHVQPKGQRQG